MPAVVQRYVAERATVGIPDFPRIADRLPPLAGMLTAGGVAPAGAPFFRYRVLHPGPRFTVEAGIPVNGDHTPHEPAFLGELPAGSYVLDTYTGGLEVLRTDTRETPDPTQWVTDLLFRLAD